MPLREGGRQGGVTDGWKEDLVRTDRSLKEPPVRATLIKPNKPVKCSEQSVLGRGRAKYRPGHHAAGQVQPTQQLMPLVHRCNPNRDVEIRSKTTEMDRSL